MPSERTTKKNESKTEIRVIIILFVAFLISVGYTLLSQQKDLITLEKRNTSLDMEIRKKEEELKLLNNQISKVDSPEFVEKYARENLNMVYPGDISYVDIGKEEDKN